MMKLKSIFYYFIIILYFLSGEPIKYDNPHVFSLIIVTASISIILMIRLIVSEKDDFKFRHLILGFICAYGVYYLENIIMN